MVFFGFLYIPLFYYFRRSLTEENTTGGVWALILGSVIAVIQFFLGTFISPGGFGYSRWLFGFVDVVCVPVLIPLLVYTFVFIIRRFEGSKDFSGFSLLWLTPVAALRVIGLGTVTDPIQLVLIPLLWTSLAMGVDFFINLIVKGVEWYFIVLFSLCILILPPLAASVYWALFAQRHILGLLMLLVMHVPMILSLAFDIEKKHSVLYSF